MTDQGYQQMFRNSVIYWDKYGHALSLVDSTSNSVIQAAYTFFDLEGKQVFQVFPPDGPWGEVAKMMGLGREIIMANNAGREPQRYTIDEFRRHCQTLAEYTNRFLSNSENMYTGGVPSAQVSERKKAWWWPF
jgi:hypothetical protein